MHHFSRLFDSGKEKMDLKQKKRSKPKLERRNAAKNIHYEATSSQSVGGGGPGGRLSSSSSSSFSEDRSALLATHSLDIVPGASAAAAAASSFRIEGVEGEIDRICMTLGLSGPDDFAIPVAAWEARKLRSSSPFDYNNTLSSSTSTSRGVVVVVADEHQQLNDDDDSTITTTSAEVVEKRVSDGFGVRVLRDSEDGSTAAGSSSSGGRGGRFGVRVLRDSDAATAAGSSSSGGGGSGGGIKGVRPPLLAPPPSITRPSHDHSGSTWDLVMAFAPENDSSRGSNSKLHMDESSSDEEDNGVGPDDGDDDEEDDDGEEIAGAVIVKADGERFGETVVLSESCSFSTSNEDDSSSTTTENMFIISPNGKFRRSIRSWMKGTLLGSGSFGTVYEGFSDDGFFFAVKEVSLLDQESQGRQSILQLEQEIALLSQFEHENIVQYLGTDKDDAKLYIFLELVTKGSLAKLYHTWHLRDSQASAYTRQILHGLKYLHDQDVVHRDIKCANILVHTDGSVKLADFGLAKTTKLNDVKSCKGTAFWMAPEVVNGKNQGYGVPADIWSLGCTVLEMLTGQLPYHPLEWQQALFRVGIGQPPELPNTLSRDARDFISQCLQVKPDDRPTAAMLLEHPFVKRPPPISLGFDSPSHHN